MPLRAKADITLPKVIDSHMVLQRDRPLPIWGRAEADEEVTVKLDDAAVKATADGQGNWKVVLPAMKADGKAHRMTISGKNKIELEDILIGEVWMGSGQSNMEMGIGMVHKAWCEEIAAAEDPQIRSLARAKNGGPPTGQRCARVNAGRMHSKTQLPKAGGWGGFSAALYFFGRNLQRKRVERAGRLIENAWGGQRIERFTVADKKHGDIYDGMIAPVKPFAIRGAIWYQGEANVGDGLKYAGKMQALIGGLRKVWGYDFPFYYVEIAPWAGYGPGSLPPLWEGQTASLKNSRQRHGW